MAEHDDTPTPDRAHERASRRGSQSNPESEPEEVRYSVDDLLENPRLVGASRRAVIGAFHGVSQKTFTLTDAAKRVKAFLGREQAGGED